jgi:thiamine-phosphate pyrophosphorylase
VRTIATVAARLNARCRDRRLPALIAMTDPLRLPDAVGLAARLPRGVALIERTRCTDPRLATLCRRRGVLLVAAGAAIRALALGADGLHLRDHPDRRASEARAWRRRQPERLIFAAAHSGRSLRAAVAAGADAILLSPVFPTASHPGAPTLGITRFRLIARQSARPVYALGGVTPRTACGLRTTRAIGIAGIDWAL